MKYILISIRDRAVDAFHPIANVRTEAEGVRNFTDLLGHPDSNEARHPDDYDLYALAEFDTDTGRITPLETPKKIADGKQIAATRKG